MFKIGKNKRAEDIRVVAIAASRPQRHQIKNWCERNHARVVAYVNDKSSISVRLWDRPDLGRWLSQDPPEPWDVLAVDTTGDLTSELDHALDLRDWCRGQDKRWVFVRDGLDSRDDIPDSRWRELFPGQKSARLVDSDDITTVSAKNSHPD